MRHLALYKYDSCPYCARVQRAIAQLGVDVEMRDIFEDPRHRRDLFEATGRQTVPCLRIEDSSGNARWMHESADIVTFLERQAS